MQQPKIELKKVKTFRGMEGIGLNCELWINGINCMFVIDAADGGEWEFEVNRLSDGKISPEVNTNVQLLNDYIATLPEKEYELGDKKIMLKPDLGMFINDILEAKEREKADKKMIKLFKTAIVFGIPNADRYQYYNYKRPLSDMPKPQLQTLVNQIVHKYCKDNVQILNNNLEALGITLI